MVPTTRFARLAAAAALTLAATPRASAAVLYAETFDDAAFAPGTSLRQGAAVGGVGVFTDTNINSKANINVAQGLDTPLMTFSFDVTAPVTGEDNELLLRASVGTGADMSGSSDAVVEIIAHRDLGNRGGYQNNGNESIFVVVNNSAGEQTFASPVDGSDVTLANQQFVVFIRNNNDGMFVQGTGNIVRGGVAPTSFHNVTGPITRFAIGNASNGNLGTFSLDNVGVVDEISFVSIPEPAGLGLLGVGGLIAFGRTRRSA